MRLTVNNIAYINEVHLKDGRIHVFVMLKNYALGDSKYYECTNNLPKTVLKFMATHEKTLLSKSEKLDNVKYQYQ